MATSTLQVVKMGEKVDRTVKVDGDRVIRTHVTEHDKLANRKSGAAGVLVTWTFDFTNVSREDLLTLASRSVLIGVRPRFRKTSVEEAEKWKERTISVLDYLSHARETLTPTERARRAFSNLTEEDKKRIAEEHGMQYIPKKKGKGGLVGADG